MGAEDFFQFSNPLFLDSFVASVLYLVCKLLARKLPRIAEGIKEASLMFLVFMCYDAARYFALDEASAATANAHLVIAFEQKAHIDFEIPMQTFAVAHVEFARFLNRFYLGAHWGGLVIFFVWAYSRVIFAARRKMDRRRKEYIQARGRFIVMNMIAACSFIAFPCAPPRAIAGYVDTLATISHTDVYTNTRRWVNPYAAMPSMHQGYSLLFAVTIVVMLRSEILASAVAENEENDESDDVLSCKADAATVCAALVRAFHRLDRFHVIPLAARRDAATLFYVSLLPLLFLAYPAFMFVVIVSTGNHFVLDAVAGAAAMGLAVLSYPGVLCAALWAEANVLTKASTTLNRLSSRLLGKLDVEMGYVMERKESEEKKGFLDYSPKETA